MRTNPEINLVDFMIHLSKVIRQIKHNKSVSRTEEIILKSEVVDPKMIRHQQTQMQGWRANWDDILFSA